LSAIKETRPNKHPTTMVGKKRRRGKRRGEEVLHETLAYKLACIFLHMPQKMWLKFRSQIKRVELSTIEEEEEEEGISLAQII